MMENTSELLQKRSPIPQKIVGLVFIVLSLGLGAIVNSLKDTPILLLMIFCLVTFLSFLIESSYVSGILFGVLLFVVLYSNIFMYATAITDLINPMDGKVLVNGEIKQVMATDWLAGVFFGIILTPFSLWYYFKRIPRIKTMEQMGAGLLFLILVCASFIKFRS